MAVMVVLYTLVFVFFAAYDLIPMFSSKHRKVIYIYSVLIFVSYITCLLLVLEVKLPSPAVLIKNVITYIFGLRD
jgi:hypothetical protein